MPEDPEPYDQAQPFAPDRLMGGAIEESERTVRTADGPGLGNLAAGTQPAQTRFLADHPDDEHGRTSRPRP